MAYPRRAVLALALSMAVAGSLALGAQRPPASMDWTAIQDETMRHFQALVRIDTSNPPGNETVAVDYLKQTLEKEGITTQVFALDPKRANLVARLKGNGAKRPLLIMGHTDVVTVDASKWKFPAFSATRDGGYVYGRGTVDDKDNATAALMVMLLLKRQNTPLERDVIFLAEAGEEGTSSAGIQFMVDKHFPEIEAEYCLAEGGGATRINTEVKYTTIQTLEKAPRGIELVARGISGHGSVPLKSNAIVHLAAAVAKLGAWRPDIRLNDTTRMYFQRIAEISTDRDQANAYRGVLSADSSARAAADEWLLEHEPRHSSMLRTSVSPNIITGGYRSNVIPSEAKATLDVRMLPDEDPPALLAQVTRVIGDPAVEARFPGQSDRPLSQTQARLDSEAFKTLEAAVTSVYKTATLPTMSTGATDMSQLRAKGIQCFGIGPATDMEDGPQGFGAHSDQERILESELHRFVRFNWEAVTGLAGTARVTRK